jgi:hypothetical protein
MFDKAAPPFHANFLVELYQQTGSRVGTVAQLLLKDCSPTTFGARAVVAQSSNLAFEEVTPERPWRQTAVERYKTAHGGLFLSTGNRRREWEFIWQVLP